MCEPDVLEPKPSDLLFFEGMKIWLTHAHAEPEGWVWEGQEICQGRGSLLCWFLCAELSFTLSRYLWRLAAGNCVLVWNLSSAFGGFGYFLCPARDLLFLVSDPRRARLPLSPSVPFVPWQSLSPAVGAQRLQAVSLGLGMQHPALLGPSFPHWLLKVHFPENGSFQTWGERDLSKRWKRKKKDEKKQADLSAAACASPFHPHVQWAEPGECARVDYLHTTTTQLQGRLFSARLLWRNARQGKNKDILRFNLHTYSQSTTYSKKRSW